MLGLDGPYDATSMGRVISSDCGRVTTTERKAAFILAGIAISESVAVTFMASANPRGFLRYCGFAPGRSGTVAGWLAAGVVIAVFVSASVRLPSVRANLWRPSMLKLLAIAVAISASVLEEVVFRKLLMDGLMHRGAN